MRQSCLLGTLGECLARRSSASDGCGSLCGCGKRHVVGDVGDAGNGLRHVLLPLPCVGGERVRSRRLGVAVSCCSP
jgi:hypothetical protein